MLPPLDSPLAGTSAHSASPCSGPFVCLLFPLPKSSKLSSWKFQPLFNSKTHPRPWLHRICLQQGVLTGKFQIQTLQSIQERKTDSQSEVHYTAENNDHPPLSCLPFFSLVCKLCLEIIQHFGYSQKYLFAILLWTILFTQITNHKHHLIKKKK